MGASREMTQEEKAWHGTVQLASNIEKLLWHRGGNPNNSNSMAEEINEDLARIEERCRILRGKINQAGPQEISLK